MRRRLVSDMKPTGRERRYRVAAGQVLRDAAATLVASSKYWFHDLWLRRLDAVLVG